MSAKKRGFTLAELLIVVAIIGVLVAIAIPVFTSSLEKAREATCAANRRALLGEISTAVMTEDSLSSVLSTDAPQEWENVKDKFAKAGYTFQDTICPDDGTITVQRVSEGGGFAVKCDKHQGGGGSSGDEGRTNWLSGEKEAFSFLAEAAKSVSSSTNNPDQAFHQAYWEQTKDKGFTADKQQVLAKFNDLQRTDFGNGYSGDTTLVWTGMRIFCKSDKDAEGRAHDIMVVTSQSVASRNDAGALKGYLLYFEGNYYRSTKSYSETQSDHIGYASLTGGQGKINKTFSEAFPDWELVH